jgi:hypothetical protein
MPRLRSRKTKALRDDLPPFRPLTEDEVISLAKAGCIEFDCRGDRYAQFSRIVERARGQYEQDLSLSELTLTDRQIEQRIKAVHKSAAQLLELLSDTGMMVHTMFLLHEEGDPPGEGGIPDAQCRSSVMRIGVRSQLALAKLKDRSKLTQNKYAAPSASKSGLHELLMVLATAWRFGSGTPGFALPTRINSPVIPFLRKGVLVIAQLDVGIEAARKWVRQISQDATAE